ncbi:hypothetical protein [uncultured Desulfovibrio sp.]|uniref:hypothetical protein n=1 Tax=uncultured Desulfovibrio sp. TaxID=167968 RepID=UPI00265CD23F|nr:hypothetical protein [uncultured Desulfovibrio sp.]
MIFPLIQHRYTDGGSMVEQWGLLGPETISSSRRTRSLGIAASVRRFNDLAVPGLGGVWFGKQIFLALLGVAVAEYVRTQGKSVQNIQVANAVEALACWLAYRSNGWRQDPRLRGHTKLKGKDDFSFRRASQRNFYVTQPMRMATVQTLPALGLVEADSTRFNSFRCSEAGQGLIEEATRAFRPYNRTVLAHLVSWVHGDDRVDTQALRDALSPLTPLSENARGILREQLVIGGREAPEDKMRRHDALAWVQMLSSTTVKPVWKERPQMISLPHWRDLQAGALFFALRDAAVAVLDTLEKNIETRGDRCFPLSEELPCSLEELRQAALRYAGMGHGDPEAARFAADCSLDDPRDVLRALVRRDGHVLRLQGDTVRPGPAFRGTPQRRGNEADEDDAPRPGTVLLPPHISFRIRDLWLLYHDMEGDLETLLLPKQEEGKA